MPTLQCTDMGKRATSILLLQGKVCLQLIEEIPLIHKRLLEDNTATGKYFRSKSNHNKYNNAFQMTTFRTEHNLTNQGFYTTFKVQGQCYHKIGGLLPLLERDPKFLQLYFMKNTEEEAEQQNRHVCEDLLVNIVTEQYIFAKPQ